MRLRGGSSPPENLNSVERDLRNHFEDAHFEGSSSPDTSEREFMANATRGINDLIDEGDRLGVFLPDPEPRPWEKDIKTNWTAEEVWEDVERCQREGTGLLSTPNSDDDGSRFPEFRASEFREDPIAAWERWEEEVAGPGMVCSWRTLYDRKVPQYLKISHPLFDDTYDRMLMEQEKRDRQEFNDEDFFKLKKLAREIQSGGLRKNATENPDPQFQREREEFFSLGPERAFQYLHTRDEELAQSMLPQSELKQMPAPSLDEQAKQGVEDLREVMEEISYVSAAVAADESVRNACSLTLRAHALHVCNAGMPVTRTSSGSGTFDVHSCLAIVCVCVCAHACCVCVCMYVCMYSCMYICMCLFMNA